MKIESYDVTAQSQRSYVKLEHQTMNVRLWGQSRLPAADKVTLSDWAKDQLARQKQEEEIVEDGMPAASGASSVGEVDSNAPKSKEELKLRMLDEFLYSLTGRRLNPRILDLFGSSGGPGRSGGSRRSLAGHLRPIASRGGGGAGGKIEASSFVYEREKVSYSAQGLIKTADGKTIQVDVSMQMDRQFMQYARASLEFGAPQGEFCDPLVINYAGTAASLTGERYAFDLDSDGVLDQISFAGQGSGFLALDKNGDGTINDGSELFGPNTGNGFDELRNYDKDGNSWIDENDEIFSKLRIWSKDADGNDQLFTLQQLDIGAIYLGDVATQFTFTDGANTPQGIMRSTSFFLKESGGAGTISHIDLKV